MPIDCAASRARENMRQVAAAAAAAADERKAVLRASRDRGRLAESTQAADAPAHAADAETQRSALAPATVPFASERQSFSTMTVLCAAHVGRRMWLCELRASSRQWVWHDCQAGKGCQAAITRRRSSRSQSRCAHGSRAPWVRAVRLRQRRTVSRPFFTATKRRDTSGAVRSTAYS